jgi:nicotinamide mononucleotide (NMN) deamidase PncC
VANNTPSDTELAVLAVRVAAVLLDRQVKVTVAESCTGGYVAKLLTDVPGSSRWFECGFVTYSNESKQRQLRVSTGQSANTLWSRWRLAPWWRARQGWQLPSAA